MSGWVVREKYGSSGEVQKHKTAAEAATGPKQAFATTQRQGIERQANRRETTRQGVTKVPAGAAKMARQVVEDGKLRSRSAVAVTAVVDPRLQERRMFGAVVSCNDEAIGLTPSVRASRW